MEVILNTRTQLEDVNICARKAYDLSGLVYPVEKKVPDSDHQLCLVDILMLGKNDSEILKE